MFLKPSERAALLGGQVESSSNSSVTSGKRRRKKNKRSSDSGKPKAKIELVEEGCLECGRDDDHGNLMICERCTREYHFYCLDPPLRSVPTDDWFCDNCKPKSEPDDGLNRLVIALPPRFTARFGEVVWAQGGNGFGWWPACIYDPRLCIGGARDLAKKQLGKKHLVFFFECHSAPFAAITESKIVGWEDGLTEDYHKGKTALSAGKVRGEQFKAAFQVAIVELGKPIDMRLDWNHETTHQEGELPSPRRVSVAASAKKRRGSHSHEKDRKRKKRRREIPDDYMPVPFELTPMAASRANLLHTMHLQSSTANQVEPPESAHVYCKILRRVDHNDVHVGFIRLKDPQNATFADARATAERELDPDVLPDNFWRFYIPTLGPMSIRQETEFGPMLQFIQTTCGDNLGSGMVNFPLKLIILDESQARLLATTY